MDVLVVAVHVAAGGEGAEGVAAVLEVAAASRGAVGMGRDHGDGDGHGGLEEFDHLLVTQGGDRVLVDFDEAAALSEASLPGVAEVLHLSDEAVVLHVETELAELIAAKGELLGGGAVRDGLQPLADLAHVVSFPIFGVQN